MFKKLFKQTFIYGVATVLPRILNYFLVSLHTKYLATEVYGDVSNVFAYFVLFNVLLSYGMETAFFRFFHKEEDRQQVVNTSAWSLIGSSILFLAIGLLFQNQLAYIGEFPVEIVQLAIGILALDALVVIPFAWLRAQERPLRYAFLKIINVMVNVVLNIFFLAYLPDWADKSEFLQRIYIPDFQFQYIFIANFIASLVTLILLSDFYKHLQWSFDKILWKKIMRYALPVLVAGLAYAINEASDRIMMKYLLPQDIAKSELGIYAACYKLAIFMTLFSTAFRLGIEPFFFSHASAKNARQTYADITKYFTIFGSLILVGVMVFADLLKRLLIRDEAYWEAMDIVPLILLANLCLGIYYNLSVWYKVTDKTKFGGWISVIAAVITIAANFLLIPTIGYIGAAIGTLAAYGTMMVLSFYWGQKHYPIPYNLKKILGYLGLALLFSAISFYGFRENYVVGIFLLLVFVSVIYVGEKKDLLRIIKS